MFFKFHHCQVLHKSLSENYSLTSRVQENEMKHAQSSQSTPMTSQVNAGASSMCPAPPHHSTQDLAYHRSIVQTLLYSAQQLAATNGIALLHRQAHIHRHRQTRTEAEKQTDRQTDGRTDGRTTWRLDTNRKDEDLLMTSFNQRQQS